MHCWPVNENRDVCMIVALKLNLTPPTPQHRRGGQALVLLAKRLCILIMDTSCHSLQEVFFSQVVGAHAKIIQGVVGWGQA